MNYDAQEVNRIFLHVHTTQLVQVTVDTPRM